MATLRFIGAEPHDVPALGRTANPDDRIDMDDDMYLAYMWASSLWEEIDVPKRPDVFDPSEHTVDEVLAYLETASDDEKARVLAAEAAGKNRKGITGEESA